MVRWGIDLGGTKTEIVGLDLGGEVRFRRRIPTPAHDYDAIVAAVAGLVDAAEAQVGVRGTVGVGTPGSISPSTGVMRNANTVVLNGRPLRDDLERALGREIRVANDANCFALSEAVDGAGAGHDVVFGVILGTGCGGGIAIHRQVLHGANGIAGEWGHSPLPWPELTELPGPPCYCGKRGCIETWVSGTGLCNDHVAHGGDALDGATIAARAEAGEPRAVDTVARYTDRLSRALATIVNVLDPDVIVLGGGASNMERLHDAVADRLPRWVFSDRVVTPVRKAVHGDSSGVRGAAWLWS
jgi:fructokinase